MHHSSHQDARGWVHRIAYERGFLGVNWLSEKEG